MNTEHFEQGNWLLSCVTVALLAFGYYLIYRKVTGTLLISTKVSDPKSAHDFLVNMLNNKFKIWTFSMRECIGIIYVCM